VVVAEAPEEYVLDEAEVLPYRVFFDRLPRLLR